MPLRPSWLGDNMYLLYIFFIILFLMETNFICMSFLSYPLTTRNHGTLVLIKFHYHCHSIKHCQSYQHITDTFQLEFTHNGFQPSIILTILPSQETWAYLPHCTSVVCIVLGYLASNFHFIIAHQISKNRISYTKSKIIDFHTDACLVQLALCRKYVNHFSEIPGLQMLCMVKVQLAVCVIIISIEILQLVHASVLHTHYVIINIFLYST